MTPGEAEALIALGFSHALAGEHQAALAEYAKILKAIPDHALTHYYAGQILLANGQYKEGWAECEWRPQERMPAPIERWNGEALPEGTLLIRGEQGIGDNIQFVRYAPLVRARVQHVVVGTLPGLGALISSVNGVTLAVEAGQNLPRLTHYIPMLSLPRIFDTDQNSIPARVPYLHADPMLIEKWRDRLSWVEGPKVGIVWAGNPDFPYDFRRSPGFDAYRALFDVPGITFFALQKGAGARALDGQVLPSNLFDLGPDLQSFDDTAAAIMNMDLVISSCTSPAHLAGALGKPVWVVLGHFADWRWLRGVETSPWYPTARLFRQQPDEPWVEVLQRVAQALAQARR